MTLDVVLAVAASSLLHAAWNAAMKRVAGHRGVIWVGQVIAAVVGLPVALWFWWVAPPDPIAFAMLAVTGVVQAFYFGMLSNAYRKYDISVVYPVARGLGVALTALLAVIVVGEAVSLRTAAGIAAISGGGVLIGASRPPQGGKSGFWAAAAIGAILAFSGVIDRYAVTHMHPLTYLILMFWLSTLVSSPFMLREPMRATVVEAWRLHRGTAFLVGLGSLASYALILFAFRVGAMSSIVAFRELSVVLGAGLGVWLFKEAMPPRKSVGVAAIAVGLVLVKLG